MATAAKQKKVGADLNYPQPIADGVTREKALARALLDPATKATILNRNFASAIPVDQIDDTELLVELMRIGRKAKDGDLGGIEAMLAAQAYSLDALFCSLAIRAKANMGEHTKAADLYLRLALKAQSQCRATAEALAMLKNPAPYIRQANIGAAVQVNNHPGGDMKSASLEGKPSETLDFCANPKKRGAIL